jgi:hypothetical protein
MSSSAPRHTLSSLVAAVVLVATPALADWEADAITKTFPQPGQNAPAQEMKTKMYGRAGVIRVDMELPGRPGGGAQSMIMDFEKRTGTMLLHAQKVVTQQSLDAMPVKTPGSCMGKVKDIDTCFKEQGYKKVGSEKVNGHPSTVYEGTVPGAGGKPQRQKLWRPTDLPEVLYVRSQVFNAQDQLTVEINVSNIQVGPQPDSRFAVPSDYRKMDTPSMNSPPGGLKPEDFQGKTPAQIQEMIRQRMGSGTPPPGKH